MTTTMFDGKLIVGDVEIIGRTKLINVTAMGGSRQTRSALLSHWKRRTPGATNAQVKYVSGPDGEVSVGRYFLS